MKLKKEEECFHENLKQHPTMKEFKLCIDCGAVIRIRIQARVK